MFKVIAFYEFRLTAVSRVKRSYVRTEFAPNTVDGATRFDRVEDADAVLRPIVADLGKRCEGFGTTEVSEVV